MIKRDAQLLTALAIVLVPVFAVVAHVIALNAFDYSGLVGFVAMSLALSPVAVIVGGFVFADVD